MQTLHLVLQWYLTTFGAWAIFAVLGTLILPCILLMIPIVIMDWLDRLTYRH